MDVNYLTADGLTIFKRALEWGAGAGCGSTIPLLLVVGDSGNPSSDDVERRSLLSTWCYGVTLIDATASQAEFDTAAAENDVIYLSEELDGSQLLLKVRNQPIGVVSEERLQWSHLGFASGLGSSASLDRVNIVDNTHPITTGLPLGELMDCRIF